MADSKDTKLSIVIRTVDQATAKIKAINDRLDAVTKPTRDFKKALGDLREKSGLDDVIGGLKGVGTAIGDLLSKVAMIGGVVGVAVAGVLHLVNEYEDLGKKAERLGVGVDFLAQMRDAAERSGAPVEALDSGLQAFTASLGQARAGTGRMAKFLNTVNPAFERQLVAAKSNEEAFDDLADAMSKLQDPAKRAALAQKTLGDAALAPLFARGSRGLKELRDHYAKLAGPQKGAAAAAAKVHDSMLDLKASTDRVKAALVEGLSPALKVIVDQLTEWLQGHSEDIKQWVADIGKKLPDAVDAVVHKVKEAVDWVAKFVDSIGGWKVAAAGVAAVMVGPLVSAFATLGTAMLATPFGQTLTALAAILALAISVNAEIQKFADALDTSHEKMLEDAVKLTPEQFRAKYPKLASQPEDLSLGAQYFSQDRGPPGAPPLGAQAVATIKAGAGTGPGVPATASAPAPATETRIKVDFANAPRGTRVSTDPKSSADVDLSVGYQMLGATP